MGGLTFTISATEELLERLDASADKAGLSRSAYILSWLPEAYEPDSQTGQHSAAKGTRKSRAGLKSARSHAVEQGRTTGPFR